MDKNNKFIPWEQLFEETIGVYGLINESYDISDVKRAFFKINGMFTKGGYSEWRQFGVDMDVAKAVGSQLHALILFYSKHDTNEEFESAYSSSQLISQLNHMDHCVDKFIDYNVGSEDRHDEFKKEFHYAYKVIIEYIKECNIKQTGARYSYYTGSRIDKK